MAVVYVTEQGAVVGIRRSRVEIRKGKKLLESLRLDDLEMMVLCGNVQIRSRAMQSLLSRGIDIALLNRAGAYQGRITNGISKSIELRRAQFRKLEDGKVTLELARCFVRGKLRNQRTLLRRYRRSVGLRPMSGGWWNRRTIRSRSAG